MKDIGFLGGMIAFWPAIILPNIGPCVPSSATTQVQVVAK